MPNLNLPPLVNGKNYAWVDLVWVVFGVPLVGITSITYSEKQDKVMNYGVGDLPIGYSTRNRTFSGSIDVYIDEIELLRQALPDKSILKAPPHTATLMMGGDGNPQRTHRIRNIMYTEDNFSSRQNDSGIIVTVPFIFAGLDKL